MSCCLHGTERPLKWYTDYNLLHDRKKDIYSLLAVPGHLCPHQGAIKSPRILMSNFDCGRKTLKQWRHREKNGAQINPIWSWKVQLSAQLHGKIHLLQCTIKHTSYKMCYPIMIHGKNSPWQLPLQYQQTPSAPEWERSSKMRPVSVKAEFRATHIRHGQRTFSPLRLECQWCVCLRISSTDPCSPAWPQTVCKRFFRGRQQIFW